MFYNPYKLSIVRDYIKIMEDIYCLWSKPQKGVPIFINGVLTESAKGKVITPKKYYYLRFNEEESLIDYEKSEFILEDDANFEHVLKVGSGIKEFKEIYLNNTVAETNFFLLRDRMFNKYLFSNKAFKKEIEKANLYGFDIIHYKALPYAHNEKYKAYN